MAPHLSPVELDFIRGLVGKGFSPMEVHLKLKARRKRSHKDAPDLTTVRRAVRGVTHLAGRKEKRGRKRKLGPLTLRRIDKARKDLVKKAAGEHEVHMDQIMSKARVRNVDPSTVSRALHQLGVEWRAPREKPARSKEDMQERVSICSKWKYLPEDYFTDKLDLIMDNKKFDVPTYARAARYQKMRRVRGHYRKKSEGLSPEFVKPSARKNKLNPGAKVEVCAGIIDCKVKLWHYLGSGNWCGEKAAKLYRGPISRALQRHRGAKDIYRILEDNDPTGYKSRKGLAAKAEEHIQPIAFPRYSPDLNPLDFFLWSEVERRMALKVPKNRESVAAYKVRLRRTAMNIPEDVVRRAVLKMKSKAAEVVEAKGADIASD